VANDGAIKKGTEKDAPDYRATAIGQALSMLKDLDKPVRERAILTRSIPRVLGGEPVALVAG